MGIKQEIKNINRKYMLHIPSIIMQGMNWGEDSVDIELNPENNQLIITNFSKKYLTYIQLLQNMKDAKWIRNKKEYLRGLNDNLSPEGRWVLHNTNWKEVEDGGYSEIKALFGVIRNFDKQIKLASQELKESIKQIQSAYKFYIKKYYNYLLKKGRKEPKWFNTYKKQIKKL